MAERPTLCRRPPPRPSYSIRLGATERRLLEAAAISRGVTLAEYLRAVVSGTGGSDRGQHPMRGVSGQARARPDAGDRVPTV